jgi:hypothetical protein
MPNGYISINEFMNGMKDYPNFDKVKVVTIYFNDWVPDKYVTDKYNIPPIAVYMEGPFGPAGETLREQIPFIEVLRRFSGLVCISKLKDKFFDTLPITKTLCKMNIENKLIKTPKYSYYKKTFEIDGGDNKAKRFDKLKSQARIERVNELAKCE